MCCSASLSLFLSISISFSLYFLSHSITLYMLLGNYITQVQFKYHNCCVTTACGHSKSSHGEEALKPADHTESWSLHKHVRESRTDAFGNICFGGLGHKTAKYVRVSSDTQPELLYELLTEQWKLATPNLLISVTGGAKNFYLRARLKNMFHRGLIKVAQTTGAWILTGGTNTGVMKHVGQAVRDHALSSSIGGGQIVAIGVATWGILHNRHTLVNPQVLQWIRFLHSL
uniref:TRPM SLOG domain-containing protein n=1 Tax=Periophthalmus magnuspinnatus TaxID=409849 RepID=A0A3B3ZWL2_9GOBI